MSGPHLKIVHAVRKRDHKARVVVDGLVTENDVHTVVQVPEIVLGRRQLAAVVLWVVPVSLKEGREKEAVRYDQGHSCPLKVSWLLGMGMDRILLISMPLSISLIDPEVGFTGFFVNKIF